MLMPCREIRIYFMLHLDHDTQSQSYSQLLGTRSAQLICRALPILRWQVRDPARDLARCQMMYYCTLNDSLSPLSRVIYGHWSTPPVAVSPTSYPMRLLSCSNGPNVPRARKRGDQSH